MRDLIGNTPLRRCSYLSSKFDTNVFIKEEYCNPGMSSKDRVALYMIEDAINFKKIKPGGTFVEASSGNTGYGIALLSREMGYKSKIFVSKSCSGEKIELLKSAGADVEICENSNGLSDFFSTQFLAQSYASNNYNTYFTNQYYNSSNIRAHYKTTGPEIWSQMFGSITHFIAGIGTGGTISGIGRYLKEKDEKISVLGVEPYGSILSHFLEYGKLPVLNRQLDPIEGIGRTFVPGTLDIKYVDKIYQIGVSESRTAAHKYKDKTGFIAGFSSAAILAMVEYYWKELMFKKSDNVVLLFPDHGSRYFSKLYRNIAGYEKILEN
ncbi:MAG: cysteine synthase family protein [Sphingobacterium sp.]|jgi:cystathionine beta-synthase|uniref:PLP-dependent cysteine synthase family protein n=1 Tax=Sphingobacterium sp. TaxID=341027 RepID=UPI0028471DCF|nr:cysteine synthase family protein [Sphingobacterium sp.]MDR3006915.1 cysteine synthase family protein [Sphingobacterium sp.]